MSKINTSEELMNYISKMDHNNSVLQFTIPGKGKFAIVLQEEIKEVDSIENDVEANPQLGQMIQESQNQYDKGERMTTSELIKSLSVEDFK
ncbi:hypothetical protein M3649_08825 [Ureibacillus chungkukjangi]|uniref:hypothetical protein n=1 Tax=Ureibacillus chungkukjangi TaxID=1202712 RepID=UPI00203BE36A|nr:hypothetical protein [Ureibacillus chungkukjangi]